LQNAVALPVGTTIGPLGTVQTGPSVMGALHGDLVRTLTDQDSQLMQASMEMIAQRGGRRAMLQVDADNPTARNLYLRLGFMEERSWTTWRRNGAYNMPQSFDSDPHIHIVHRQQNEWQAEYKLAEYVRPPSMGGLGWLRPVHERQFRRTLLQQLGDWLSLRQRERLVIRSDDEQELLAPARTRLTWLHRLGGPAGDPALLCAEATEIELDAGAVHAYLFGEATVVLALREILASRGLADGQVSAKAYWGRGRGNAGHGEPASR